MDILEQLKQEWVNKTVSNTKGQQQIWDKEAADYKNRPIPSFNDNHFLQEINELVDIQNVENSLDVGCGSGVYSIALAPFVKETIGVDVSGLMIQYANELAVENNIKNASFSQVNWAEADIDKLGFRKNFDLVFAHTTPAVSDYVTVNKLNECSKGFCFVEKPTRRKDLILDQVMELIGIPVDSQDKTMINLFTYLWMKGYCPKFWYEDTVWNCERNIQDTIDWCLNRARLKKVLSKDEEDSIKDFIQSKEKDGVVQEIITTTLVNVGWKVF